MSHLFAYLSRMKLIRRWSLMRNTHSENIQEHSTRVAMIAFTLAVVRQRIFGGMIDPERTALLALFHDASEVLTGDLPTPIKYRNPGIKEAYGAVEKIASEKLLSMVPEALRADFASVFCPLQEDAEHWDLVKAADKFCAHLKCLEEIQAGNHEFDQAEKTLTAALDAMALPEIDYFREHFLPSFSLTLDELW